ncbi:hypothetical protein ACET3Z_002254 [Daucus carota]
MGERDNRSKQKARHKFLQGHFGAKGHVHGQVPPIDDDESDSMSAMVAGSS